MVSHRAVRRHGQPHREAHRASYEFKKERRVTMKVSKCTKCDQRLPITCLRCEHTFDPRGDDVRKCPNCQSPYFDVPRKDKAKKEVTPK